MGNEDRQLQALLDATVAATRAEEQRIALLVSLREDFSSVCDRLSDLSDLAPIVKRIDEKTDVILAWIFAEQSTDRRDLEQRLRELRKKTNGLTFPDRGEKQPPPEMTLAKFRQELTAALDLEELRTLCFDLGVEYDSLRGEGLAAKVRELVDLEQRRDGVGRLRVWLEKQKAPGG